MDKRAAKKYATEQLAEVARVAAGVFGEPDGGASEKYTPPDRARIAHAYGELADELARRYDPRLRTADPVAPDPDQLPLFPEPACPQDVPARTATATTPGNGS